MKLQLAALWQNPHARYAAIAYTICKVGLQISEVWFNSYDQKLRATADILEALAVSYGLMASAAGNQPLKETGEEIQLLKAEKEIETSRAQIVEQQKP